MNHLLLAALGTTLLTPPIYVNPAPQASAEGRGGSPVFADDMPPVGAIEQGQSPSDTPTTALATRAADPWPNDANDTRLLIGPTARMLKRGEAYVDAFSLFFPSVQVGLSDRFSVGIGTPLFVPQTAVLPGQLVWITPKVQVFAREKTQAAVGIVHFAGLGTNGGAAYAAVTRGTANASVTAGLGADYPSRVLSGGFRPVALLGAEKRVSAGTKLITENFIGGQRVHMAGVRFIRRRRALDLTWAAAPGVGVLPVPFIRFSCQLSGPNR